MNKTIISLTRERQIYFFIFHFLGNEKSRSFNSRFSWGNMLMLNYRSDLKIARAQIFQEAVPKIFIFLFLPSLTDIYVYVYEYQ